jgi:S1-C subfamily serine protease
MESRLKALQFGRSGNLSPGDSVTVLGFPGSLQQSLNTDQIGGQATTVVSNTGTVSQVGVKANPDPSLPAYQNTIVHQAPVNHGDSGGPLLNSKGQVVGVDTLTNTSNQSQYYAIASDYIQRLLPALEGGQSRGLVGWSLSAVDAADPNLETELLGLYQSIPAYSSQASSLAPKVAHFIQQNNINGVFDGGDQPGSPAANATQTPPAT